MASIRLILLGFALALVSGCGAHLRPKLDLPASTKEKLKLRAALVVPAAMEKKSDDIGSFDGLGSFTVDTSDTVLPAVKEVLRNTFENFDIVKSADLAPNADVVLVLKTMKVVHPSGRSSDFQLRFDLRATVLKQDGVQVIDAAYNEFIEGQKKPAVTDALATPTELAIKATLAKLEADLRASLGPPPSEVLPADAVAAAAGAADGGADFSDFPPPPPPPSTGSEPAPAGTATATTTATDGGTELKSEPVVVADAPPPPPPSTPGPEAVVVAPAPPPAAPKSNAGRVLLATTGALLFAGGYLAPPLVMTLLNLPGGTNQLAYIPLAGPLLALLTNPFLSQDLQTMILTVAGTAGQVVGLVMVVAGIASGGGSGPPKKASLMIEGKGWALTPTISPGGIGFVLVH